MAMCPACRRDAPVLMRGLRPTCALCGATRTPADAARAVNLAGRPARVGGRVSRVLGWSVAICGTVLALLLGGGAQLLFPNSPFGLLLGVPIFMLSTALALALVLGGRRLSQSGDDRAHAVQLDAIRALAREKGGELEVVDVTAALGLGAAEADALLTELAKTPGARVDLDVDDDGRLRYRFADFQRRRFADIDDRRDGSAARSVDPDLASASDEAEDEAGRAERVRRTAACGP